MISKYPSEVPIRTVFIPIELPENHEIHKKFENFQELVDEITSGFHDYEKEQIEPAYEEDASDNEEDYEDIEDD